MKSIYRNIILVFILFVILFTTGYFLQTKSIHSWQASEIKILESLSISSLPPLSKDMSNRVANSLDAARFGHQIFFDTRFSINQKISCASCHKPELFFTDGLELAQGALVGQRNTMTIVGTAYSPWLFWDGRKDSLWSQALSPLENTLEHMGSRVQFAHIIFQDKNYKAAYEKLFGAIPDLSDSSRFPDFAGPVKNQEWNNAWQAIAPDDKQIISTIFVNIGKAIAAYERLIMPGVTRFDDYVNGLVSGDKKKLTALNRSEIAGLRLFIGKAQCTNCHNGPLFTNNEFHNTGLLPAPNQLPSIGRVQGVRDAHGDPFNCLGKFSDADEKGCADLKFSKFGDELIGTHKVPTLRNVAETGPYMHAGQIHSLKEVIEHYNLAPQALIGHNEAKPLQLNMVEVQQLVEFLKSLSAPLSTDPKWLNNPSKKQS